MGETYSIPGFRGTLTNGQQILAKSLIEENGFRAEMRGGSAKTVRFEKDRKYGYINSDVTKYGGIVGYTFSPHYIDASPFNTENETSKWFESNYPGSKGKFTFHSVPSKNSHYLIILDVDLALRVFGVTGKTVMRLSVERNTDGQYQHVRSACIECFKKIGVAAKFSKEGNIIRCMGDLAAPDWPKDWIEWVVQNAGQIIKGVEIDK